MTVLLLSAIEAAEKIMNYVCLTEVNQIIRFSVIFLHEGGMHAFMQHKITHVSQCTKADI